MFNAYVAFKKQQSGASGCTYGCALEKAVVIQENVITVQK